MAFPTRAWIPKGLYVRGEAELLDTLHQWLKSSDAPTIGDTSRFHGAYWVTFEIDGLRVKVAADTTRGAVRKVVAALEEHPNKRWRVVANQNGRINKVIITDSVEPGWYAYLPRGLDHEIVL
jgi:hypothetical protein